MNDFLDKHGGVRFKCKAKTPDGKPCDKVFSKKKTHVYKNSNAVLLEKDILMNLSTTNAFVPLVHASPALTLEVDGVVVARLPAGTPLTRGEQPLAQVLLAEVAQQREQGKGAEQRGEEGRAAAEPVARAVVQRDEARDPRHALRAGHRADGWRLLRHGPVVPGPAGVL